MLSNGTSVVSFLVLMRYTVRRTRPIITTRAAAAMAIITVRLAPALAPLFSPEGAMVEDVTTPVDVVTGGVVVMESCG